MADQERFGAALVSALRLTRAAEQEGETEETAPLTVSPEGYAVLRDGKLCRYLTAEQAVAVDLLLNACAAAEIPLRDSYGRTAVLEISGGSSRIRPVFSGEGQLTGLRIDARVDASVVEQGAAGDAAYGDLLTARLEEYLAREIESVLRASRDLKADYLGLAARVERAEPAAFRALDRDFAELLPELELEITVSARLRHVNDRKEG
jgi:spore germination protein KC